MGLPHNIWHLCGFVLAYAGECKHDVVLIFISSSIHDQIHVWVDKHCCITSGHRSQCNKHEVAPLIIQDHLIDFQIVFREDQSINQSKTLFYLEFPDSKKC
jgi:hypothetical protein